VLIGKPLWSSGRAADWEWFQFGQRRTINARNHTKEVGEYALHVQCAWHITHGDEVVVGNHDLYYPPEETDDRPEDFNWEPLGSNRRDKRIAALFQGETRQFLVRRIEVGEAGRFRILLDNDYALDVFPDDSLSDEHWRISEKTSPAPREDAGVVTCIQPHLMLRGVVGLAALARRRFQRRRQPQLLVPTQRFHKTVALDAIRFRSYAS